MYEGGSVYLTEIPSKPKISLEGENVRQPGISRCSQDPDSCVCDPAAFDSLRLRRDKSQQEKQISHEIESADSRCTSSESKARHVNCSERSISTKGFYKDVYVLVCCVLRYLFPPFFLGIYLSKLKHNLKNTQISLPLISVSC